MVKGENNINAEKCCTLFPSPIEKEDNKAKAYDFPVKSLVCMYIVSLMTERLSCNFLEMDRDMYSYTFCF